MSKYLAEQNQRNFQRMREALSVIGSNKDTFFLGSLIATLDALFCALESVDADWEVSFRKNWGILEEVYAFVLDEGRNCFSDDEQKLLNRAMADLKLLVDKADPLCNYPPT